MRLWRRAFLIAGLTAALLGFGAPGVLAQDSGQEPAQSGTQTAGQDSAPARVTVSGLVRNQATGEPLPRALVQIEGDADTGTLTDGDGRFEIPGVPAGPQMFRVAKPGFRDRDYATEETGAQAEGPAHSVLVAAGMPELDFALAPDCAIHGHIELSTGDPADQMRVVLLKQIVSQGRPVWGQVDAIQSNGEGNYRFGGLRDGNYVVYTQPAFESDPAVSVVEVGSAARVARSGYPAVYYPDAHDISGAARVRVSNGSQAEANLTLDLEAFYPVTASANLPANSSDSGKDIGFIAFTSVILDGAGHLLPYAAQFDPITRSVQTNLPDGTYTLVVRGFQGAMVVRDNPDFTASFPRGQRHTPVAGSVDFTVAGHPVTGLRIPVAPPPVATLRLRLVHSANAPPGNAAADADMSETVNITASPADAVAINNGESVWSMDKTSDAISFTAQPGTYWLNAYVQRKGLCAGAISGGGLNLAREPLPMSLTTSPPPLELTLRDDCATLALNLPPTLATFAPGEEPYYTVYVVPDFDSMVEIPPMTMHPSSGPTLPLDSLTPGSYHVYVFDSPVHLEYRNAAAMAALGVSGQQVTVTAGATTNLVLEVAGH
jgi:hypothetical protein